MPFRSGERPINNIKKVLYRHPPLIIPGGALSGDARVVEGSSPHPQS